MIRIEKAILIFVAMMMGLFVAAVLFFSFYLPTMVREVEPEKYEHRIRL